MPNPWAEEYLKSLLPNTLSREDEPGADDLDLDKIEDPMLELHMLWHSNSAVSCLRLAFAMLQKCPPEAPASMVADLIECFDHSTGHLEAIEEALPRLRAAAEDKPEDGDSQADLAIALGALDETDEAMELYRKALDHEDSLCFLNHRECLNNIGWNLYLRKQYNEALPWFEKACWIEPPIDREIEHAHTQDIEPPYKLALENQLLCLAKLGRLRESAEQLTAYFDQIGRLPRYETEALRKLGLDADIAFIRRNIERSTKAESIPSA
jgi:tetratricopeptide (TPR) repeat protein